MTNDEPTGNGRARRKPRIKERVRKSREAENLALGKRVRIVREQYSGLTQKGFGERLGVSRAATAHWERGRGVQRTICQEIARVWNVNLEWLLTGNGTPRTVMTGQLVSGWSAQLAEAKAALPAGDFERLQNEVDSYVSQAVQRAFNQSGVERRGERGKLKG